MSPKSQGRLVGGLRSVAAGAATDVDGLLQCATSGADAVLVDLVAGAAAICAVEARLAAQRAIDEIEARSLDACILLRLPSALSPGFSAATDVVSSKLAGVAVAGVTSHAHLQRAGLELGQHGHDRLPIVAEIETARGVLEIERIVAPARPAAVWFRTEGYLVDVGGRRSDNGAELLHARSRVVLAARAHGLPALEVLDARLDDDQLRHDAARARDLGFTGAVCAPEQALLANATFGPAPDHR